MGKAARQESRVMLGTLSHPTVLDQKLTDVFSDERRS